MNKFPLSNITLVVALAGLSATSVTSAQESALACGGKITNIYFGNGVANSWADARAARNGNYTFNFLGETYAKTNKRHAD